MSNVDSFRHKDCFHGLFSLTSPMKRGSRKIASYSKEVGVAETFNDYSPYFSPCQLLEGVKANLFLVVGATEVFEATNCHKY